MKYLVSACILIGLCACEPVPQNLALGTLERERIQLRSTISEIITAQPQLEGTRVRQGELLVQFDTQKQLARLAIASAEQAQALASLLRLTNGERPEDIAQAQARLASSQATLTQATLNYQRIARLMPQNLASQESLDRALATRDTANAELDASQENLSKLINGARDEDITQAQAVLDAATAKLQLEQVKLADLSVVATRDGRLDELIFNVGEYVPANAVISVIQADTSPYARVYIPENQLAKLSIGQALNVYVDGVTTPFVGHLRWISHESAFTPYYALNQDDRSRLVFLAEITLGHDAAQLPSGIPTQVALP